MSVCEHILHKIPPVFDEHSRILILGTMPSPKSRETGFYYGHPQNRFWRVLSRLLDAPLPSTNDEKTALLLKNRIALWDVLASCDICGASDASIRNARPNDIAGLLAKASIQAVFTTGKKAFALYEKLCLHTAGLPARCLPSTSAANAAWTFDRLIGAYQILLQYL